MKQGNDSLDLLSNHHTSQNTVPLCTTWRQSPAQNKAKESKKIPITKWIHRLHMYGWPHIHTILGLGREQTPGQDGYDNRLSNCLHNFPEGLATSVMALHDQKVSLVLAIAIAVHTIPEGLCVAFPIFIQQQAPQGFPCGSFWNSRSLAGLGYLAIFFPTAVLFGFVSGTMVIISIRELGYRGRDLFVHCRDGNHCTFPCAVGILRHFQAGTEINSHFRSIS